MNRTRPDDPGTQRAARFASRSIPQLRVEVRGATVTSDAGLVLSRQSHDRLGQSAPIERHLTDPRSGRTCQFPLLDLFRQSIS